MKPGAFIIFFTIVMVIYGLVNSYIFVKGLQAIPQGLCWRLWYIAGFWLIASTFILARILERTYPCGFTGLITWIGSFWLAFMLYFILIAVFIDIARLINHFLHIFPHAFYADYQKTKLVALLPLWWRPVSSMQGIPGLKSLNSILPNRWPGRNR